MSKRKIVFVIVEGPSDDEALGVLLSKIYDKDSIYVHITHGDITTQKGVTSANIVSRIGDCIKHYAKQNHFKTEHFKEIIHIVDMDGAYIPDTAIIHDQEAIEPIYSLTSIHTSHPEGIITRNNQKRDNINRLKSTNQIWSLPYRIYFMSCNLDHALYGKMNSTDEEKEKDAYQFAKKYHDDIPGFLHFLKHSDFTVGPDYKESWKYITQDFHSLERHTNLGICFTQQIREL